MREYSAYPSTGGPDAFISRLMTECVIDTLEIIDIADYNCECAPVAAFDTVLNILLPFEERMSVLDTG